MSTSLQLQYKISRLVEGRSSHSGWGRSKKDRLLQRGLRLVLWGSIPHLGEELQFLLRLPFAIISQMSVPLLFHAQLNITKLWIQSLLSRFDGKYRLVRASLFIYWASLSGNIVRHVLFMLRSLWHCVTYEVMLIKHFDCLHWLLCCIIFIRLNLPALKLNTFLWCIPYATRTHASTHRPNL